ncbi:MAG: Holliday junction branch migration protein RuvA [Sphingomonadaceae bacterium]|uniref:Holliday junction branch migration protein RuvA n=1 Tax=Thermaurantiacus sp. TaxID=2820283 RepID=UPI00298EFF00|nr:Holliday junction branch migration protein RuvA [Thermaurantiacus sp.]MCS6986333.1 Holliday junction branch migration protein RuvA [Sphingomonadaceae bacterium]MDW8414405.1 Holliday junction branch migration protein RuvA [Thermaurantiacus sp.]
MIASLEGRVARVEADHAVIDVGGVGYLVLASAPTLAGLRAAVGGRAFLLVETQVREDAITLFGFATEDERLLFRLLASVQGVGGRTALALLSTLAPAELAQAIEADDRARIARAPGVGARLAARIATELKGKTGALSASVARQVSAPSGPAADALAALQALGFRPAEAGRALALVTADPGVGQDAASLVRAALRHLKAGAA